MKNILNDLLYGRVCGISNMKNDKNNEFNLIEKEILLLEKNLINIMPKDFDKLYSEMKNCYQQLLLLNLREGYKYGVKLGFQLSSPIVTEKIID